jgi:hypothetical protein
MGHAARVCTIMPGPWQLKKTRGRITMIRKLVIASLLAAGVALSGSVLAQAQEAQSTPASATAPAAASSATSKPTDKAARKADKAAKKAASQAEKAKRKSAKQAAKTAKQVAKQRFHPTPRSRTKRQQLRALQPPLRLQPVRRLPAAPLAACSNRCNGCHGIDGRWYLQHSGCLRSVQCVASTG